jgi:hypothetical protein
VRDPVGGTLGSEVMGRWTGTDSHPFRDGRMPPGLTASQPATTAFRINLFQDIPPAPRPPRPYALPKATTKAAPTFPVGRPLACFGVIAGNAEQRHRRSPRRSGSPILHHLGHIMPIGTTPRSWAAPLLTDDLNVPAGSASAIRKDFCNFELLPTRQPGSS